MTPVDQQFLRERNEAGDCWRACIATMLDLPLADVPHIILDAWIAAGGAIEDYYSMPPEGTEWWPMTQRFVLSKGFEIELVVPNAEAKHGWVSLMQWMRENGHRYVILSGKSLRGCNHSVIWDTERDEMAHDPHPSRSGVISGTWMDVAFIVPKERSNAA